MLVFKYFKLPACRTEHRIFVSCIAGPATAGRNLDDCQPDRDEHHRGIPLGELGIDPFQRRRRIASAHQLILDHRLGDHHEQRSRNSLSGNIRDHQCQMVAVDQEEIIKVPSHLLSRRHGCIEIELRPLRKWRKDHRKYTELDICSKLELLIQPVKLRDHGYDIPHLVSGLPVVHYSPKELK